MENHLISCIFICVLGAFVTFLAFSVISYEQEVPKLDCDKSSQIEIVILNMVILSALCTFVSLFHTCTVLCMGRIFVPSNSETICERLLAFFLTILLPVLIMIYFVVLACYIQSFKVDLDRCGKDGYQLKIIKVLKPIVYNVGGLVLLFIIYQIAKCCGCRSDDDYSYDPLPSRDFNDSGNFNQPNDQQEKEHQRNRENLARDHERQRQQHQKDQENYRRQQQQQAEQRLREQQQAQIKRNNRI
eukprot:403345566